MLIDIQKNIGSPNTWQCFAVYVQAHISHCVIHMHCLIACADVTRVNSAGNSSHC